jgi:hypothetical protein
MSYLLLTRFLIWPLGGEISSSGELTTTTIINQQIRFVIIMIEFVFSRFKSIPLGPPLVGFSGTQLKGKKPIFFERFSEL